MAAAKRVFVKPYPASVAVRCEIVRAEELGEAGENRFRCKTSQFADSLDPRVSGVGDTESQAVAAWRKAYCDAVG